MFASDLGSEGAEGAFAGFQRLLVFGAAGGGPGSIAVPFQLRGATGAEQLVVAFGLDAGFVELGQLAGHVLILGQLFTGKFALQTFNFEALGIDFPLLRPRPHLGQLAAGNGHLAFGFIQGGLKGALAVQDCQGLAQLDELVFFYQQGLHPIAAEGVGDGHLADFGFGLDPAQGRNPPWRHGRGGRGLALRLTASQQPPERQQASGQ